MCICVYIYIYIYMHISCYTMPYHVEALGEDFPSPSQRSFPALQSPAGDNNNDDDNSSNNVNSSIDDEY